MKKAKTYKSEAFAAIHETAVGTHEAGVIDNQIIPHAWFASWQKATGNGAKFLS